MTKITHFNYIRPVVAQGHKRVTVNIGRQVVGSIPIRENLIFSLHRSGVEAKCGVELRHLTRTACGIRKFGNGMS